MSAFVVGPNDKLDDSLSIVQDSNPLLSSEPQIQDLHEIQNTIDVTRLRIDQDIEKLEGAIRALKSRRNSLAAISRLPPEILSKIFVYCAATYELPQLTLDWAKITHVSRHWRNVAIGCPHLWTTPVFARPRWVEEMLKRSKMALLFIDARFTYMAAPKYEAIQLAMNHISRTRELKLDSSCAWFGKKLFSSVPRAAPMLQTLVLSTSTMYSAEPFLDNYSIPPELFSDDSSQLRCLELTHCDIDWTSHLLRGLTHLKIHNTAPGTRPSTLLFLDVLEQLPTLTVLDLKDALPHVSADGSSTVSYKRKIELRSLTNLHLSGSNYDCSDALRHLSVSSIATLKLYCRSTAVSEADFSSILTFVSGFWEPAASISSAAKPPIRSLKIVSDDSTGFSLLAWPAMLSFERLSGDLDLDLPSIELGFQWSSTIMPGIWNKVFGETCAALPLEQLASLDVSASQMAEQTWLRMFGKLTHLKFIRLLGMAAHTLLSAMIAEPSNTTGASARANSSTRKRSRNRRKIPPAVYFPALRHLTIEDTSFDSGYDDEYAELEDLKDCLMERYERKAEVHKLTLWRCHRLTAEHVDELGEIVVDVIWDGLETGFTESDFSTDYYGDHFGDSDIDDHIHESQSSILSRLRLTIASANFHSGHNGESAKLDDLKDGRWNVTGGRPKCAMS
ncbi:uncharacterized protein LACBIDRAFT_305345 [Laccaria bicolor S238N-H82]|uniref:Predicted protein n=1 Tax=Laccaria bicolor (strain S238N-H82 / ATCC MYA-4686) TaxID=486041 RepID=B0CU05_LACBS|nr:uncharacterized protein LACBIDRAFT_305345 [Laccaria bicolor S238N-H82]EDR14005.1 predicted protein [Laccaria bicolor S238N-H82]|eukprot:XP_001874564.1 predicted protein [Laccaria bicolor S238N-H82]